MRPLKYYIAEMVSRPLRFVLVKLYKTSGWHVATVFNKNYSQDVVNYINGSLGDVNSIAEIGCGACDILRLIKCDKKYGYDNDAGVLSMASLLNKLYGQNIFLIKYDFSDDTYKKINWEYDVLVMVNWTHEVESSVLKRRLQYISESMPCGSVILIDTVHCDDYKYNHDINFLFDTGSSAIKAVYSDLIRTVYAVRKKNV